MIKPKCNNSACQHVTPGVKAISCEKCDQPLSDAKGYLVFEKDDGSADYVSASTFYSLLSRGIELVVLSACQSGMALGGESIFNGAAQQLIDARIPAVVAMQYTILVNEASSFTEQFYRVLGHKRTLLEALSAGRKWMGVDSNQWYRPVLYLRWQDNDGGSLWAGTKPTEEDVAKINSESSSFIYQPHETSDITKTGRKLALLVGVSQYGNGLAPLPGAIRDIEALKEVLQSDNLGDFDNVQLLTNPDAQSMREATETLFANCAQDDLVLLFFSGHGLRDSNNKLYFGTSSTYKSVSGELVKSSAVSASFIHDIMDACPSQQQVVILDCCFSGAFPEGLVPKDDSSVDIRSQLGGIGRAILTSSTSLQLSFSSEGEELSFYTRQIVEGIKTGKADLDGDKFISAQDINDYVSLQAKKSPLKTKPYFYSELNGKSIFISKVPRKNDVNQDRTSTSENLLDQTKVSNVQNRRENRFLILKVASIVGISFLTLFYSWVFISRLQECLYIKKVSSYSEEDIRDPKKTKELDEINERYFMSVHHYDEIRKKCSSVRVEL